MTTEKESQQGNMKPESITNDINQLTQDTWDEFLEQVKQEIQSPKKFRKSEYKQQFINRCTRAKRAFYDLQIQFISDTKELIEIALKCPENDFEKRKQVAEEWERIYKSTLNRATLILHPIQNILAMLHENDKEVLKYDAMDFILPSLAAIGSSVLWHTVFAEKLELSVIYVLPVTIFLGVSVFLAKNGSRRQVTQTKLSGGLYETSNTLDSEEIFTTGAQLKTSSVPALENKLNGLLLSMKLDEHIWFSNNRLVSLRGELEEKESVLNCYVLNMKTIY